MLLNFKDSTWNWEFVFDNQFISSKPERSRSAWGNITVWDVGVSKTQETGQPNAREAESELGHRLTYADFAKILQIIKWKGIFFVNVRIFAQFLYLASYKYLIVANIVEVISSWRFNSFHWHFFSQKILNGKKITSSIVVKISVFYWGISPFSLITEPQFFILAHWYSD